MVLNKAENPFAGPICSIFSRICAIQWRLPFIPQLIQATVQIFVFLVLCVLYCTVGIVHHCYSIFVTLLKETRSEIPESDLVGKSAWALVAGFYLLLAAPCWLIIFPFMLLGWLWRRLNWFGIILYVLCILAVFYLVRMDGESLQGKFAEFQKCFAGEQKMLKHRSSVDVDSEHTCQMPIPNQAEVKENGASN